MSDSSDKGKFSTNFSLDIYAALDVIRVINKNVREESQEKCQMLTDRVVTLEALLRDLQSDERRYARLRKLTLTESVLYSTLFCVNKIKEFLERQSRQGVLGAYGRLFARDVGEQVTECEEDIARCENGLQFLQKLEWVEEKDDFETKPKVPPALKYERWKIDPSEFTVGKQIFDEIQMYRGTYGGRPVVIKTANVEDTRERQIFDKESRIWTMLSFPNILRLYGVSENREKKKLYLIMEPWEENLTQVLKTRKDMPLEKRVDIAYQVASGMKYLHGRLPCILHRNLGSACITLASDGGYRISDFGLSKVIASLANSSCPVPGESTIYLSPELIVDEKQWSQESDVFSYGMLLYEIMTGESAFKGQNAIQIMKAILNRKRPELPDIPKALQQLMEKCWHDTPRQRPKFPEIVEILQNLKQFDQF